MIWVGIIGLLLLISLPAWWVRTVLKRYNGERDDFPGTGGDMARHLLMKHEIAGVGVESSQMGDHYDGQAKMVRLTPDKLDGKSLTAVVVAAHEVGHALQDHRKESMFRTRTAMAYIAMALQRIAPVALMLAPLLAFITPAASRWSIGLSIAAMLSSTLLHLVTLPLEWDASFNKALPMLHQGDYLAEEDMQRAKQILRAAAFTYVAGSLMSLLNVARWWRYLRR